MILSDISPFSFRLRRVLRGSLSKLADDSISSSLLKVEGFPVLGFGNRKYRIYGFLKTKKESTAARGALGRVLR